MKKIIHIQLIRDHEDEQSKKEFNSRILSTLHSVGAFLKQKAKKILSMEQDFMQDVLMTYYTNFFSKVEKEGRGSFVRKEKNEVSFSIELNSPEEEESLHRALYELKLADFLSPRNLWRKKRAFQKKYNEKLNKEINDRSLLKKAKEWFSERWDEAIYHTSLEGLSIKYGVLVEVNKDE